MTLYGSSTTPEPHSELGTTPPVIPHQWAGLDDVLASRSLVPDEAPDDAGVAPSPDAHAEGTSWPDVEPAAPLVPEARAAVAAVAVPDPSVAEISPGEISVADIALPDFVLPDIAMPDTEADDASDIPPWDRRPLMVVLAGAIVLVLLAILSGMASASMFGGQPAAWQAPGGQSGPEPTPGATSAPVAPAPVEETITLSGVGDVIMGTSPNSLPPNGGAGFFDEVKAALAADLVMGNLESRSPRAPAGSSALAGIDRVPPVLPAPVVRPAPARGRVRPGEPGQQPHQRHGGRGSAQHPRGARRGGRASTPAGRTRSPLWTSRV